MIPRSLFAPEHETFRQSVARFFADEVMPHHARWEEQGYVDRSIWNRAGELGLLCMAMPEEYGGGGASRLYSIVMMEEQARAMASGVTFSIHSDVVANYINNFGTQAQKQEWLPRMATGEAVGAIAMTEPGAGSDLQAMRTRAREEGDDYVINGSKMFITNGHHGDIFVVAVKTGSDGNGKKDVSLILVERDRPGFRRGKPLSKMGMKGQDTCELFFDDVRVPRSHVLGGEPGHGFLMLMKELAWERLMVAINAIVGSQVALDLTLEYSRSRKVFGKPIADHQNSRFKLAEMKTEITIGQVFVDRCIQLQLENALMPATSAMVKYWTTELHGRVVDQCLQLHGGYGYMMDYPIAHAFVDARASRIYLGANEVMKDLIARSL